MTGLSPLELAAVVVAVACATALQASIGFGMGMLAAPVVALVDPTLLPGMLVLLAVGVTAVVVGVEREHVDLRGTGWALTGRVPGSILGAALVAMLPTRVLATTLALVVLLGVGLAASGWAPRPRRRTVLTAGFASGVLGTATSIGGPPMALVWQGKHGAALRGSMGTFFLVGSVLSAVALSVAGTIDARTWLLAGLLLPAVAAGYALSRVLDRRLSPRRLRRTAIAVSCFGATLLLLDQVVGAL